MNDVIRPCLYGAHHHISPLDVSANHKNVNIMTWIKILLRDGSAMQMRCEKMRKCEEKNVLQYSAMQCDANFNSIFALHAYFAVSSIFAVFFAYFVHFSRTFHNFFLH
jgi:hypothetical protein